MTDIVVAGGGIAGLAAADRLARAGVAVTLFEAADRLGGKIHTTSFAGQPLDMGAEALATRDPAAIELCRELSLDADLVMPAASRALVWTRRGLQPLPGDALTRLPGPSRLLSPLGRLRRAWDLVAPSYAPNGDVAIGAIVRSRLGGKVLEQIVDPLLGGIHAGRCDDLSARALAPQFIEALATGKGLIRGLRTHTTSGPAFATLRGGLGSLTAALATRAREAGADVQLGTPAPPVHASGPPCIVATPARAAARLLAKAAPAAAAELRAIVHAPAAVVALAYPADALAGLPAASGFVTAGDGRLVRACTWSSAKWEHLRGDPAILKAFIGRAGSPPPALGDRDLATAVHRELALAVGLGHPPVDLRVERFACGIPQYSVGHLERIARIDAALPGHIALAGACYRGAGIAACVRSGQAAADHVLRRLA